ncbi:TonB-dependent receptor [Ferruginibacter lapsinanis]|uniref:TonB-dependent receptor family protein n=1 Tax=Ferruginibacter lapsinanis TaxID=563172 RepID=UPI001E449944|nr:TonB-dependent receptor [Ferruginibacter lapsinanis]UEG51108.1 TonB-dependent receptor [Ferruginibacter lapsinanis]
MQKIITTLLLSITVQSALLAQNVTNSTTDTSVHYKNLPDISVVGRNSKRDIQQMPEVVGTSIYAGKKSSLIVLDNVQGNVATNTMRQVIAKVPGIQIWESDGSGIQIGIAARGLSPNRSWEFNVRQNGYDIAADPFGYPEAYYNPQLQAVQRLEIVRGQGALQYGPQFGGLVNYILRNGSEIKKPIQFETQQTAGSNGLINTYNAIGGDTKKFHYYTFFDHRSAEGYRQNSRYYTNAGFGSFTYKFTDKFSVTAEVMRSNIRSQQPGGLTDAQMSGDITKSFRNRNWFDITWTTLALISNYQINDRSKLNVKLFGVLGDRSSIGFVASGGIIVADTINKTTNQYNPRNLNTDNYRNYGLEVRYLTDYNLFNTKSTVSVGARLYKGNTYRYVADGKGSTGTDYDMTVTGGIWTRDLDFGATNTALFAENIFRITDKLLVIPGIRYEYISGHASGRNGFNGNTPIILQDQSKKRSFILAGVGAEYHVNSTTEIYANISQAYRPVQFADLTAPPTTDVIDQNLKDAKGYNADFGYRGKIRDYLFFDASAYYLQYNNRIGVIVQQRTDGSFYNYRTNVGNSTSKGFEGLVEFSPIKAFTKNRLFDISVFASYSFTDARYGNFQVITKNSNNDLVESNLKNKKIENAPENILRSGLSVSYKSLMLTGQLSYTDDAFADANNTIAPSANAQNGVIPSYTVADLTASYKFSDMLNVKAGINNIGNEKYFTRRSGGFPGPGALPSDGRTFFISIGAKF